MTKSSKEHEKLGLFRLQLEQWISELENGGDVDNHRKSDALSDSAPHRQKTIALPFKFESELHERDWHCMKHLLTMLMISDQEKAGNSNELLMKWTGKVIRPHVFFKSPAH